MKMVWQAHFPRGFEEDILDRVQKALLCQFSFNPPDSPSSSEHPVQLFVLQQSAEIVRASHATNAL